MTIVVHEKAQSFCHVDIAHLHQDDYLLLKEEKEFWVMHLHHEDGLMFDLSVSYDITGREWMRQKGYTSQFVYELLEKIPSEFDWILFTKLGERLDRMEVHKWL